MPEFGANVRYTPTFSFFSQGKKVRLSTHACHMRSTLSVHTRRTRTRRGCGPRSNAVPRAAHATAHAGGGAKLRWTRRTVAHPHSSLYVWRGEATPAPRPAARAQVDEFTGTDTRALEDHLWLHNA